MRRARLLPLASFVCALLICSLAPATASAIEFSAPPHSLLEGKRTGPDHFVLAGIEEQCKEAYFEGAFYRHTLELIPIWANCMAKELGGLYSTFILYGCGYLVRADGHPISRQRWRASVDLTCRSTYSLRWQVYGLYNGPQPVCTTKMYPQKKIGTAVLSNMEGSPGEITVHWHLNQLEFEAFGSALLCGIPEEVTELGASYTGYTQVRATDVDEKPVDLSVKG